MVGNGLRISFEAGLMAKMVSNQILPRKGFTLVELLVVIAIVGVLVGLLLPAVQSARSAARRMSCGNRMKQIGLAVHNYHSAYNRLPRGAWVEIPPKTFNGGNWEMAILPFLEADSIHEQLDFGILAVDQLSPANVAVMQSVVTTLICPSTPDDPANRRYRFDASAAGFPFTATDLAPSDYSPATGVRGEYAKIAFGPHLLGDREGSLIATGVLFGTVADSSFASILDGLSNTILLGERTGGGVIYDHGRINATATTTLGSLNGGGWGDLLSGDNWLAGSLHEGISLPPTGGPCAINCTNARGYGFHSFHEGGCHFLLADGSLQFVSSSVAPEVLGAAITRRGREDIHESLAGF